LRGAQRRSNPASLVAAMDCFAALAMKGKTSMPPHPEERVFARLEG
jgi:hypothetical protein